MNTTFPENEKLAQKPHILVVDDDDRIRDLVSRFLSDHDFVVLTAGGGAQARNIMAMFAFDAMIVDVMMPEETGFSFTQSIRKSGVATPVLLLTALGEVEDRIQGFESGADDYLPKPFEPRELILRLQAILRRTKKESASSSSTLYSIGHWRYDTGTDILENDKGEVSRLTSVESTLLRVLLRNSGQIMSREALAKACDMDSGERTIDVQVTRLRRKIEEDTKAPRHLQTVRGKGYILRAEKLQA